MLKKILIYSDYGTSEFCLRQLINFFKVRSYEYELITAEQIRLNYLEENEREKLLCFGGGFDLGYLKSLGKLGCENIQNFVKRGGNYLGICAGAYFACDFIEFDLDGPLEVKGPRLGFFNGKAIGPINKNFKYNDENFSHAIKIKLENKQEIFSYLNGGPFFQSYDCKSFIPIGMYKVENAQEDLIYCNDKLAILETTYGHGKCVLSGVHFEFNPNDLDITNKNIKNNVYPKLIENPFDLAKFILNLFV